MLFYLAFEFSLLRCINERCFGCGKLGGMNFEMV
jgi:hypothetical protein